MLTELANRVYVKTDYWGGNVGAVLSARGALLIDAPLSAADAHDWAITLRDLGAESIYGIVNTDFHPERYLGDANFYPVRIIGHEATFKQVARYRASQLEQLSVAYRDERPELAEQLASLTVYTPEVTVEDRLTLHLGDRQVEVLYLNGHTPASLGVYLAEERVLFAGDNVVNDQHPAMVHANSEAWLGTLARIEEMDVDVIVPGERGPTDKSQLARLSEYIQEMRSRVDTLYESGATRRETVDKVGMLELYPVRDHEAAAIKRRRRENVERVYAEIRTAYRKRK